MVGVAISPEYIYALGPGQLVPDNRRYGVLWMDRKGLATAYDMEGAFNDVTARVSPGASVRGRAAARWTACSGPTAAWAPTTARTSSRTASSPTRSRRTAPCRASRRRSSCWWRAFLLYTILTRLVQMQRSQVGLLKAFGYSGAEIALHYLKLALVISLLGAALGVATGMPFAQLHARPLRRVLLLPDVRQRPGRAGGRGRRSCSPSWRPRSARCRRRCGRRGSRRPSRCTPSRRRASTPGCSSAGAAARAPARGAHAGAQPRAPAAALRGQRLRHRHRRGAPRDDDGDDGRRALPHGLAVHGRAARGRAGAAHGAARRARPCDSLRSMRGVVEAEPFRLRLVALPRAATA